MNEASSATDNSGRTPGGAWASLAARIKGLYALSVYLPVSLLARRLRDRRRARRGVRRDTHDTALPQVAWTEMLPRHTIRLVETDKADGNVNLAELAILAQAAAAMPAGTIVVEIGTFVLCTAIAARATCTSTADCLQAIEQAQQNTRTVVAEFVQVKHVSLLDEPLVSRGRFAFKRPDRVRLSIATPQPATVVINGRDVHIPGITERDRAAFAMTPMAALFTQLGAIFAGSMQTLQESFQVSARAADSGIEMRLQPRQAAW